MSKEVITISKNLLFIEERGKAVLVEQAGRRVFLPRSLISYIRKESSTMGGTPVAVTIPLWLADEKSLE